MIDQLLCVRFGIQILVGLCPYQACVRMCVCAHAQLGLTLFNPVDSSRPGSSVYGILQEKILEWVAMPSSRRSSHPVIKPMSPVAPELQGDSLPLSHWVYML